MKLTFWGAAQTVTGSKHLLQLKNGKTILLDCGLFQGRRSESREKNERFGFDAASIDVVILSHAHIDHAGLLPKLYKEGFRGRVYATHATYDLCSYLLHDSAHIQQKDAVFVNKIHRRKKLPSVEPLYDHHDVDQILSLFVGLGYDQPFSPLDGVVAHFRDAGHILGSASVNLEVKEGDKTIRLGFTGDIGQANRVILRDPQPMQDCDYLITESTYGGREHDPPDLAREKLAQVIRRTAERNGKVIIPCFAVGRTQEIVHNLDQLANEGLLPRIPVYVDSPLAVNATGVFLAHPECFDADLLEYMRSDDNPFGFERLNYIRDAEKSKALNGMQEPMVIISASGMCEAGRVLHHLRNNIQDKRTTVLMVGYCAEHTLGKRLIDKVPEVRIFGDTYDLHADVEVMNNYSAHADEPGMVRFIGSLDKDRLKNIFLVHGDLERQKLFKEALSHDGHRHITIPAQGESFDLN